MRIPTMHALLAGSAVVSFGGFAMAGLPAVYALQTFSGSASASASSDRTNQAGGTDGFSLGYNAIAGGASTMSVGVYTETFGSSNTGGTPTNGVNRGTFGSGYTANGKYYKDYFGGNPGTSYSPTDTFRDWDASSSVSANLSGSGLGFSADAQYDAGISDWTQYRYTDGTYTALYGTTGTPVKSLRAAASGTVGSYTGIGLEYVAAAGQSMDLSAATGLTDIRLEGSGTAWATSGQVEFSLTDIDGVSSVKVFEVLNGAAMGDFSASITDLSVRWWDSQLLDLTQISKISIGFWSDGFAFGRDAKGDNTGFAYSASQVSLVGYAVPAPGALALLGVAGLVGGRRRR